MGTVYINADIGNDLTGDGTISLPYETFQKAYIEVGTGDTIFLQSSSNTYLMPHTFTDTTPYREDITVIGENANTCILDGNGLNLARRMVFSKNHTVRNLTWQNFVVIGEQETLFNNRENENYTFDISDCVFRNFNGNIFFLSKTGTILVNNCVFYNYTLPSTKGIFVSRTCDVFLTRTIIANTSSTQTKIASTNAGQKGTFSFKNCIVANISNGTMTIGDLADVNIDSISHSCLFDIAGVQNADNTCIYSDPLFVDTDNDLFDLRPSSPCIGTGTIL